MIRSADPSLRRFPTVDDYYTTLYFDITKDVIWRASELVGDILEHAIDGLYDSVKNQTDITSRTVLIEKLFYFYHFVWRAMNLTTYELVHSIYLIKLIIHTESENERIMAGVPCVLQASNIGTVLLCSVMLALKMNSDHPPKNTYWSSKIGIPLQSLNVSEIVFLEHVRFGLFMSDQELVVALFHTLANRELERCTVEQSSLLHSNPPPSSSSTSLSSTSQCANSSGVVCTVRGHYSGSRHSSSSSTTSSSSSQSDSQRRQYATENKERTESNGAAYAFSSASRPASSVSSSSTQPALVVSSSSSSSSSRPSSSKSRSTGGIQASSKPSISIVPPIPPFNPMRARTAVASTNSYLAPSATQDVVQPSGRMIPQENESVVRTAAPTQFASSSSSSFDQPSPGQAVSYPTASSSAVQHSFPRSRHRHRSTHANSSSSGTSQSNHYHASHHSTHPGLLPQPQPSVPLSYQQTSSSATSAAAPAYAANPSSCSVHPGQRKPFPDTSPVSPGSRPVALSDFSFASSSSSNSSSSSTTTTTTSLSSSLSPTGRSRGFSVSTQSGTTLSTLTPSPDSVSIGSLQEAFGSSSMFSSSEQVPASLPPSSADDSAAAAAVHPAAAAVPLDATAQPRKAKVVLVS